MCIYVSVCIFVCVHIHTHIHTHLSICVWVHVSGHAVAKSLPAQCQDLEENVKIH